ncbi:MAG: NrdH-redoxin [Deltaproteobacteria bacterium]|nr:NrdH-redoxin [Deltaproteobacteria bacterium]
MALGGWSCCRKGSDDDGTEPVVKELPKLELRDETPELTLTWLDAKGDFHVVTKIADVPVEGRDAVRVYVGGRQEGTGDQFYVADLRVKSGDGTYPVTTMSRSEWDLLAERRRAKTLAQANPSGSGRAPPTSTEQPPIAPPTSKLTVIVYGAEWCQPCHDAMKYLRRKGINAVEKNIEEDEGARREMEQKLRRAGIPGRGSIPVIDVRGKILQGFSSRELDKAIAEVTKGEEL